MVLCFLQVFFLFFKMPASSNMKLLCSKHFLVDFCFYQADTIHTHCPGGLL